MPEYLSPGVYIEEKDLGPKSIEGVSTSTAGFLGVTERGPITPTLITSFPEFVRIFGGYRSDSNLAYAVEGFFRNGGKRMYVGRIIRSTATNATHTLLGNNNAQMKITAKNKGTWANNIVIKISNAGLHDINPDFFRLRIKYLPKLNVLNQVKDTTPTVSATDEELFDNLSSDPDSPSYYRKVVNGISNFILLEDKGTGRPYNTPPFRIRPLTKENSDEIAVRILKNGETEIATVTESIKLVDQKKGIAIKITHDPDVNKFKLEIKYFHEMPAADINDATVADHTESFDLTIDNTQDNFYEEKINRESQLIQILEPTDAERPKNNVNWIKLEKKARSITPMDKIIQKSSNTDTAFKIVEDVSPKIEGKHLYVQVDNATSRVEGHFNFIVYYFAQPQEIIGTETIPTKKETIENLSPVPGDPNFYQTQINNNSDLIQIADNIVNNERPSNSPQDDGFWKAGLSDTMGGTSAVDFSLPDVDADVTRTEYAGTSISVGDEIIKTGFLGFEEIDDISIASIPDAYDGDTLSGDLIDHCENLKNRFAIIQSEKNSVLDVGTLRPSRDSKYAALYVPWLKITDPLTQLEKIIPPAGHMAGVYARSDIERGVHKAPANEVLRGVNGLQIKLGVKQDILNPKGVNVVRSFPGRGQVVWGARTTSTDPSWKYINVRRLFIFIEKSIEKATQWVVFEPNNERLWSRVTATISQFLTGVWKTGALMGVTPDEAFFVKCDRTTMTQDDIDNGRLVCVIGIAPTKPAEFVIFRISQTKAGAEVTEL